MGAVSVPKAAGAAPAAAAPAPLPRGAYYALTILTALNVINLWHRYLIVSRCWCSFRCCVAPFSQKKIEQHTTDTSLIVLRQICVAAVAVLHRCWRGAWTRPTRWARALDSRSAGFCCAPRIAHTTPKSILVI